MTATREPAAPSEVAPELVVPDQRRQVMRVRKRNGDLESVDINKIVKAVERWVGRAGRG